MYNWEKCWWKGTVLTVCICGENILLGIVTCYWWCCQGMRGLSSSSSPTTERKRDKDRDRETERECVCGYILAAPETQDTELRRILYRRPMECLSTFCKSVHYKGRGWSQHVLVIHYLCIHPREPYPSHSRTSDNDIPNKGHNRKNDTLWDSFSIVLVHFNIQVEDSLSTKDKIAGPKRVHYSEISLYTTCWCSNWQVYKATSL